MMLEDSPTAKHNSARCVDCGAEWDGPQAHIEGTFHGQTTTHEVLVSALVKCHEPGCCD